MSWNFRIDMSALIRARQVIGADETEVDLKAKALNPIDEIRIALKDGVEVSIDEVEANSYGLLQYKGEHVVVYIPDHGKRVAKAIQNAEDGNRFHVSECQTLQEMRKKKRFERYMVRAGMSHEFRVAGIGESGQSVEDKTAELLICRNCLDFLNYEGYKHCTKGTQKERWKEFSLEGFFDRYQSCFAGLPSDLTEKYKANQYTADWPKISKAVREEAGWKCVKCKVDCRQYPAMLHVHHSNGLKNDNRKSNLMPLCAGCHQKEPNHQKMRVSRDYLRALQGLRMDQGIVPSSMTAYQGDGWDTVLYQADLAHHDLLSVLRGQGYGPPQFGFTGTSAKASSEESRFQFVWPQEKLVIVTEAFPEQLVLSRGGWTIQTVESVLRKHQTNHGANVRKGRH